jgi:DNA-binding CsgD family transcriptional regulator
VVNAGMRGRPIAPLVLSAQERAYLERQVRRHRVARSLSERCRAILRCADGLPSKSVAAELGIQAGSKKPPKVGGLGGAPAGRLAAASGPGFSCVYFGT